MDAACDPENHGTWAALWPHWTCPHSPCLVLLAAALRRCYGEPLYFYVSASSKRFAHRVICSTQTPNRNTTKFKTQQQKTRICSHFALIPCPRHNPQKGRLNLTEKKKRSLKLRLHQSKLIRSDPNPQPKRRRLNLRKQTISQAATSAVGLIRSRSRSDPILAKTHEDEDWRL